MFKWRAVVTSCHIFKYCVSEGDQQEGAGPGLELQGGELQFKYIFVCWSNQIKEIDFYISLYIFH